MTDPYSPPNSLAEEGDENLIPMYVFLVTAFLALTISWLGSLLPTILFVSAWLGLAAYLVLKIVSRWKQDRRKSLFLLCGLGGAVLFTITFYLLCWAISEPFYGEEQVIWQFNSRLSQLMVYASVAYAIFVAICILTKRLSPLALPLIFLSLLFAYMSSDFRVSYRNDRADWKEMHLDPNPYSPKHDE